MRRGRTVTRVEVIAGRALTVVAVLAVALYLVLTI